MNHKGIITAIVIFGLIIVGMFVFAFLKNSEIEEMKPVVIETPTPQKPSPYDSITYVDGKHFFDKGRHSVLGEILVPTPCDLLNWETVVEESMPEKVRIDFSIVNNTESCAQTVTPQRFYVDIFAGEKAVMSATINGREVNLNLVEALPGETPERYEFSPKG
jgi:hypothetical protein